jgi:hypothetical protein
MRSRLCITARLALGLLALLASGCAPKLDEVFRDNLPPEVRLTQAPVSATDPYFYAYRMNWVGFDPDGRVDYFLIAVDPPDPASPPRDGTPDSVWQRSNKNEEVILFRATQPDTVTTVVTRATDFHTFAVAAVDNKHSVSTPVWRSFNAYTICPFVRIDSPRPNTVFIPIVTPVVRIQWSGVDPDGVTHTKPIKYKFKLFRPGDPDFPVGSDPVKTLLEDPRQIRWKYAPTFGPNPNCPTCAYWDSTPADTTEFQYTNLIPGDTYLFAVTGFDEAGAYDPEFVYGSNLLQFQVSLAGTQGPTICMFNEFFNFCYDSGGYPNDPSRYVNVEVPAGDLPTPRPDQAVTFNWYAVPPIGADIRRYRWVLDLQDLSDETPRTNELTDWYHWSAYSLTTTSATVGPFVNNGESHLFYIEAEDNTGLRSLGIIHFTVVRATFENAMLFVKDTRLPLDQKSSGLGGPYDLPSGRWPSSAELDTFFFAQGGKPWREYPGTAVTVPGIFSGYPGVRPGQHVDTLGTRGIPSGLVPLATLGKYRLVVWYTDDIGATYSSQPSDVISPITSLRLMSSPGNPSTISTYLKQGGKLWLFGGGAAAATLSPWNKRNTNPDEFTNTPDAELIPGRFMYDFAHWQSAVSVGRVGSYAFLNIPDLFPPWGATAAPGRGWTNQGVDHDLNQPDYTRLSDFANGIPFLEPRTCATDPPSPVRICDSFYLVSTYPAEFMGTLSSAGANFIREDADPDPDRYREESTLDTLYFTAGGTAPYGRPVMTYYHGFQTQQVVFCGFPIWFFQRAEVQKLADFVLQDIFGLDRVASPVAAAPARTTPGATAAMPTPAAARRSAAPQRR